MRIQLCCYQTTSQKQTIVNIFNAEEAFKAKTKLQHQHACVDVLSLLLEITIESNKASHLEDMVVGLLLDLAAPIPRRRQP